MQPPRAPAPLGAGGLGAAPAPARGSRAGESQLASIQPGGQAAERGKGEGGKEKEKKKRPKKKKLTATKSEEERPAEPYQRGHMCFLAASQVLSRDAGREHLVMDHVVSAAAHSPKPGDR